MVSRRDQLQAYRFLSRRYAAALLGDDADSVEGPLRRGRTTVAASLTVAVLLLVGAALYGLLRPGGDTTWRDGTSLIVVQDTGTRYVYLGGMLHPVVNYASARLVLHGGGSTPVTVAQNALSGTPHGQPVGIPGAPDSLPSRAGVVTGPWTVCAEPAVDPSGVPRSRVEIIVGRPAPGTRLPADGGVLAQASDGTEYLVWHGERLRVAGPSVLAALNYASTQQIAVGDAWLTALLKDRISHRRPCLASDNPARMPASSTRWQARYSWWQAPAAPHTTSPTRTAWPLSATPRPNCCSPTRPSPPPTRTARRNHCR
jgi:type VII secretion protein EccB